MATDADDVVDDYRHALEDLSTNMRFEISNLTVIARENTEYALRIADVLQQHILKAPPNKKLPALYVLDSIVKNVGTPYTIYFGRNLFKTFMESYAVVDAPIRRKMEEMLRTWKDPIPGSLDKRPAFPHDLVRPIENALLKARAASTPQQTLVPGRPRSAMLHRDTPTPPGLPGQVGHPGNLQQQQQPQQQPQQHFPVIDNGRPEEPIAASHNFAPQQPPVTSEPYQGSLPALGWRKEQVPAYLQQAASQPVFSLPASLMPSQHGPPGSMGASGAGGGVETLSNDIQNLVAVMKVELSRNPNDASVQNRFRALLNLQGLVQSTSLPQDQLELIKNKVTELAAVTMRPSPAQASAQNLAFVPMQGHATLPQASSVTPAPAVNPALVPALAAALGSARASAPPAPSAVSIPRPSSQASVTVDKLLGKGALAALLSRTSTNPRASSTQQLGLPHPSPSPLPIQMGSSQPATSNPMNLLEQLRQAGILPSTVPSTGAATGIKEKSVTAPQVSSQITPPSPPSHPPLSHNTQLPSVKNGAVRVNPDEAIMKSMTAQSLQQEYHPEAVAALYEDLGPACTQCGRRFKTDAEGKKKKVAHMDWHFRVHQRTTEAEKKGTHRSWYVDQQDWLKSREVVDSDPNATAGESAAAQAAAKAERRPQYIAVPDPGRGINNTCPICQEKFENKWLDTAQEWVWLGAVLVGNRAYHATCHAEATRDRQGTPNSSQPPLEGLLGKRKAETSIASPKVRTLKTCV